MIGFIIWIIGLVLTIKENEWCYGEKNFCSSF